MEVELGKETRGRWHVKLGRGGLVDVEFLVQGLQLVHGAAHPAVRTPSTTAALAALGRLELLAAAEALAAVVADELSADCVIPSPFDERVAPAVTAAVAAAARAEGIARR
jgi:glutamine synthetase adenylyltransferase